MTDYAAANRQTIFFLVDVTYSSFIYLLLLISVIMVPSTRHQVIFLFSVYIEGGGAKYWGKLGNYYFGLGGK